MNSNGFDRHGFGDDAWHTNAAPNDAMSVHTRAVFNASVARLDSDSARRLRDMRLHAVQQRSASSTTRRWMIPVASAAAIGVAVLLVWPRAVQSPGAPHHVAVAVNTTSPALAASNPPDIDLNDALLSENAPDPELLGNLAFYDWLETQPAMQASGG